MAFTLPRLACPCPEDPQSDLDPDIVDSVQSPPAPPCPPSCNPRALPFMLCPSLVQTLHHLLSAFLLLLIKARAGHHYSFFFSFYNEM